MRKIFSALNKIDLLEVNYSASYFSDPPKTYSSGFLVKEIISFIKFSITQLNLILNNYLNMIN